MSGGFRDWLGFRIFFLRFYDFMLGEWGVGGGVEGFIMKLRNKIVEFFVLG